MNDYDFEIRHKPANGLVAKIHAFGYPVVLYTGSGLLRIAAPGHSVADAVARLMADLAKVEGLEITGLDLL